MPIVGQACPPAPTPYRFDPHFAPQPLHLFAIGFQFVILAQLNRQSPTPHARIEHINLIERTHDPALRLTRLHWLVVKNRTRHVRQLALSSDAQFGMFCFHQLGTLHRPSCLDFF